MTRVPRQQDGRDRATGAVASVGGLTVRWTHASSYAGMSPASLVHQARLRRLRRQLRSLDLPERGLLVDLGCSDGFVLSELRAGAHVPPGWRLHGYDRRVRWLKAARLRGVTRSRFRVLDLNDDSARPVEQGDLVTCLETLEHVGDYGSALQVIHHAVRPGGRVILSMPVEVGPVGLVKLLGRPLARRRPYADFFCSPGQRLSYTAAVAMGGDIGRYRSPARVVWGPHLGFDHRTVRSHIRHRYVETGLWTVDCVEHSAFGANVFLLVRRADEERAPDDTAG
jgi:2-polyprenyl-3-methyl-5-hydroxy-6-metoxy-1,4-benzoquinol methylase